MKIRASLIREGLYALRRGSGVIGALPGIKLGGGSIGY